MDDLEKPSGTDLTVTALTAVRSREGLDMAMVIAEQMITAAAIYARERGVDAAITMLVRVMQVLPDNVCRSALRRASGQPMTTPSRRPPKKSAHWFGARLRSIAAGRCFLC
jgi:hypothetical protein